jgi:DNA ligase D-like protein (predicted polymerase)
VTEGASAPDPAEIELTNLDTPLFEGSESTKRDLVDYLDAVAGRLLPELHGRPLSVIRALRGRRPFMQKNVPRGAPPWLKTVAIWAEASRREVVYAICDDRATLRWFANQRAVEYHPTLMRADLPDQPQSRLVLDLDPPEGAPFEAVVRTAHLVRWALADAGLEGAVKTSGSKGLHVFVPVDHASAWDVAAATRALAARAERLDPDLATTAFVVAERGGRVYVDPTRSGGGSVVAAYSPRIRAGTTVSFPVAWDDLDGVDPHDFTIRTVPGLLGDDDAGRDPWAEALPAPQKLPPELIAEGHEIPPPRVAAMHEGKRRKRERRAADER